MRKQHRESYYKTNLGEIGQPEVEIDPQKTLTTTDARTRRGTLIYLDRGLRNRLDKFKADRDVPRMNTIIVAAIDEFLKARRY